MISYTEALRRVEELAKNRSEEAGLKLVDLWCDPQTPAGVKDRIDLIVSEWLWGPGGFDDVARRSPSDIDDERN